MPFTKKIKKGPGKGKHRSKKSGRLYTPEQLKLYYATGGFKK